MSKERSVRFLGAASLLLTSCLDPIPQKVYTVSHASGNVFDVESVFSQSHGYVDNSINWALYDLGEECEITGISNGKDDTKLVVSLGDQSCGENFLPKSAYQTRYSKVIETPDYQISQASKRVILIKGNQNLSVTTASQNAEKGFKSIPDNCQVIGFIKRKGDTQRLVVTKQDFCLSPNTS